MSIAVFTSFLQLTDNSGNLLSGGTVTVYDANSTTPRACYTDTGLSVSATNPIPVSTSGRHTAGIIYISTAAYKCVVKTSAGVTVATYDNIDPGVPVGTGVLPIASGGTSASTPSGGLAALGGVSQAELTVLSDELATVVSQQSSTEKTHLAVGTTGQRPSSPIEGDVRRNTTTSQWESYNGSAWENVIVTTQSTSFSKTTQPGKAPTIQRLTSGTGATYTLPTGVQWIEVEMVAGGGGGGAAITNAGSDATNSSFGSWTAVKGSGGPSGSASTAGGAGGTGGTDSTGTKINRVDGATGTSSAASAAWGGRGGASVLGGAGPANAIGLAASAAKTNTGGGGGGGNGASNSGGGGGAGEYVKFLITSPAATYTYTVGAAGTGGAAGTTAGGNGAAGIIVVTEFYN